MPLVTARLRPARRPGPGRRRRRRPPDEVLHPPARRRVVPRHDRSASSPGPASHRGPSSTEACSPAVRPPSVQRGFRRARCAATARSIAIVVVVAVVGGLVLVPAAVTTTADDDGDDTGATTDERRRGRACRFSAGRGAGHRRRLPRRPATPRRGTGGHPVLLRARVLRRRRRRQRRGDRRRASPPTRSRSSLLPVAADDPIIDYITRRYRQRRHRTQDRRTRTRATPTCSTRTTRPTAARSSSSSVEGSGPPNDEVAARADAVGIAEEIGAFAVWGGPVLTDAFADELAARQIPCIGCRRRARAFARSGRRTSSASAISADQAMSTSSSTSQEAGRPPGRVRRRRGLQGRSGCSATSASRRRRRRRAERRRPSSALAEEGIELAENVAYQLDPARLQEQAASAIAQLKEAGVTTVIFSGDPVAPATFTQEATAQDYFPEWILGRRRWSTPPRSPAPTTRSSGPTPSGISPLAARVDPTRAAPTTSTTGTPASPRRPTARPRDPAPAAVFFAALQAAGPDLTRENSATALFRRRPRRTPSPRPRSTGATTPRGRAPTTTASTTAPRSGGTPRPPARRDPRGGPGHVALRRRRRALPARRVARGGHPGLRPGGRRDLLRDAPPKARSRRTTRRPPA